MYIILNKSLKNNAIIIAHSSIWIIKYSVYCLNFEFSI